MINGTSRRKGFTLIELLIVIGILGVLAVVVLLALNPVQQFARARDGGRISGVTQLGHAMEAFSTTNNSTYPAAATWDTTLLDAGEIAGVPGTIGYSAPGTGGRPNPTACTQNVVNSTWCYNTGVVSGTNVAVVYTRLESGANNARCGGTNVAWAIYSSADGRGGVMCTAAAAPTLPATSAGYGTCATSPCNGQFLP